MRTDWTTVATFWSVEEAQLARGFLEVEGIVCHLEGVATAGNFWHLSNATGGVKLRVAESDASKATEMLDAVQYTSGQLDTSDLDSDDEFADSDSPAGEIDEEADGIPSRADFEKESSADEYRGLFDKLKVGKQFFILLFLAPVLLGVVAFVMLVLRSILSLVTGH